VFIFRYAEVLLNYAEAMAELGECSQDVLDITINRLRDRVAMPHLSAEVGYADPNWPDYGYELSPLLYEIRRERAVELLGEGFRWDDIVRWKAGRLLENPKSMLGMKVSDAMKEAYDGFSRTLNADGLMIVYPDKTSRTWDDKLYLHPLPIDETTLNPNLLPNNPGW
ncbi:MAG: RagB/SusD family nutrient uptake outer membrane protein, partial [Muribaculaceae bacterium]|nr:RagB/SusD family nutrient uptake outer membrane protein [Muribaculaceae bacterium]